jgi:hypothetical protein
MWLSHGFGNIYKRDKFLKKPKVKFRKTTCGLAYANYYIFEFNWMRFGFDIGYKFKKLK